MLSDFTLTERIKFLNEKKGELETSAADWWMLREDKVKNEAEKVYEKWLSKDNYFFFENKFL